MNIDLNKAMIVAKDAVKEAGVELRKYYGNIETLHKGDGSGVSGVVTELDRKTEKLLAAKLGAFSPDIGFAGEEYGVQTAADTTWLVDPIDGTAHYIRGLPFCTTMIALIDNGNVMLSVIYDFVNDDMYSAIRGQGAYRNDDRIYVSDRTLTQALVSFETHIDVPANYDKYSQVRGHATIISTINCGFEFAMIASGKLDGRIALDPFGMDWDYAPGSLLVTEAGGVATNIGSTKYDHTNHEFVIANPIVHKEITSSHDPIFPLV